jgi:hypothetical protein
MVRIKEGAGATVNSGGARRATSQAWAVVHALMRSRLFSGRISLVMSQEPENEVSAATADAAKVPGEPSRGDAERARPREIGGRDGPDPTRYGDWELRGRCIDF